MATGGAGGLTMTAIETMLAHGARDWHRPADLAAAREELAALVAAAGERERLRAALPADAGRGAAGARDEPMRFAAFVAWLGREHLAICAWEEYDADRRAEEQAPGEWRPLGPTAVLERSRDAPRAGGAGEAATPTPGARHPRCTSGRCATVGACCYRVCVGPLIEVYGAGRGTGVWLARLRAGGAGDR